jgi:hypothetical protein
MSFNSRFLFFFSSWRLKFSMSKNHAGNLEEDHFTTNLLNDIVSALQSCDETGILQFCSSKISWKVI